MAKIRFEADATIAYPNNLSITKYSSELKTKNVPTANALETKHQLDLWKSSQSLTITTTQGNASMTTFTLSHVAKPIANWEFQNGHATLYFRDDNNDKERKKHFKVESEAVAIIQADLIGKDGKEGQDGSLDYVFIADSGAVLFILSQAN